MCKLQALIEFEQGEFHAHQCERFARRSPSHKLMFEAQNWLVAEDYIELVGGEYFLTSKGNEAVESAVIAMLETR